MDAVTDPLIEYPVELIERSGRSIWRPFRNWVDLNDCTQEAWLAYFTNKVEFDARIAAGEEWYVAKAIRNWVGEYARKQKANASGYNASDDQFYGRRKAKSLLEFFLCGESVPSNGVKLEGKVKGTASDGTDRQVELLDVERAWEKLDQGTRDALWASFGPEAPDQGTADETDRKRGHRALGRLLDLLNGNA